MTRIVIVGEMFYSDLSVGGGPVYPAAPLLAGLARPPARPPSHPTTIPPIPDQGLPGGQPYPDQGLPGVPPRLPGSARR